MRAVKDSGFRPAVMFVLPVLTGLAIAITHTASGPPAAHAQVTGGTSGTGGTASATALAKEDFQFLWYKRGGKDNKELLLMNETDLEFHFNRARCACGESVELRVGLTQLGRQKLQARTDRPGAMKVFVGNNCASEMVRQNMVCEQVGETNQIYDLVNDPKRIEVPIRTLFGPAGGTADGGTGTGDVCTRQGSQTITVWIDADNNSIPDLVDSAAPSTGITFDGEAPPAPRLVNVQAGNEALSVSWEALGNVAGFQGYIVFCSRGGDTPVFKEGTFSASYNAVTGCGPTATASQLQDSADAGAAAERGPPPEGIRNLDPRFICSDLISSGTQKRIFRLQNGIPYVVGIASVDKQGNASPIGEVMLQRPTPTVDFYRDYRADGGTADGGFCAVARGGRGGAWLAAGALVAALALVIRRRRRR